MAKSIDSLECGKCGDIFHQLEGFIKHKMANTCSAKEEIEEPVTQIVKAPSPEPPMRQERKTPPVKKMTPVLSAKPPVSKKPKLESQASPQLQGYLWKKQMQQEQLKEDQKRRMRMKSGKSAPSDEEGFPQHESSSDDDMSRCGDCSGCLIEEDCLECDVCLRKMEDPDLNQMCMLRECQIQHNDSEVYKVEKIIAKRFRHGRFEYFIKWKGYSSSENTWEPKENILSQTLLEEFENRHSHLAKRSTPISMPRKRKKFYYTESSDESSGGEHRSRMFTPASALDAQRGRSSKQAAMNFIKSVCSPAKRPTSEHIPVYFSSEDARSPSPQPPPGKKIIIEVPDPKEEGKYIRVKDEARRIRFLKDCDLQPVVSLGYKVPEDEEDLQNFIFDDIIKTRVNKIKSRPQVVPKSFVHSPSRLYAAARAPSVAVKPQFNKASASESPKKSLFSKKMSYQDKIDSFVDDPDDPDFELSLDEMDDLLGSNETKTLAQLRDQFRKQNDVGKKAAKKPAASVQPKVGARKNFQRQQSSKTPAKGAETSGKAVTPSANERVFVVMPDGSMVEVSTTKGETPKNIADIQKKIVPKMEKKLPPKPLAPIMSKKVTQIALEDCTGDAVDDSKTLKLPNTLQLVQSELPLSEAENNSKLIGMFLFRQVISPNEPNQQCLLCPSKSTFREALDLEKHYSIVHELASQTFKAEFSENIVFVCVPPDVTEQTTLNSVCRFCDMTLKNLQEVRTHYPASHNKVVRLVQESQVTELSSSLFCSICSETSSAFPEHHAHMKAVHRMQTYVCKFCGFITSRANRLKSHVKQKHPQAQVAVSPSSISAKGSKIKLKCPVCQLFINGKVKLDQHILLAHSVQTGPDVWSCAKCFRPCGNAKDFTVHVFSCSTTKVVENRQYKPEFIKKTSCVYKCNQCFATFISEKLVKSHCQSHKHTHGFEIVRNLNTDENKVTECFLCEKMFASEDQLQKHYLHVHMTWMEKKHIVKHSDSSDADDTIDSHMTLDSTPDKEELVEMDFPTKVSNYCPICDTLIASYPNFYQHMQETHESVRCFQCAISSCNDTYTSPKEFLQHSKSHPQDRKHNCSICDKTFAVAADLKEHNMSVEHGSQYMKMHEKCRPSGIEARNFQCKVCQTWFGLQHYLIQHMETDNHDYKCGKCGLQYLQPGSRRLHIQQVHPEIATVCEFCGVKMMSTQAVWGHLKSHGIVHECNSCHRRFLHREQVTTHMETHDPPVQCPWEGCTRQLVTKISLFYHLKTHRGDEDYKCPHCPKGFLKQKLLEAHMRTHEAAKASKKADESIEANKSEGELIQLICAGCEKGFDDEDQFAGHSCATMPTEDEDSKSSESKKDEDKSKNGASLKKEKDTSISASDLLSSVLGESVGIQIESTTSSIENVKAEKNNKITPVSEDASEKSDANFDDISNEMVLALEKNLEDSSVADTQVEFTIDTEIKEETGTEKFLESSSQELFADSEGQVISDLSGIGEESMETEQDKGMTQDSNEDEQTVVMMVTDSHDGSEGMELELPDDGSYAGTTLLKVPTSDGKQVLLIPFSSADGTTVLSLPPGLTLEADGSEHGQSIQVALEDGTTIDENGEPGETRYIHVEGEVMSQLLQGEDDMHVEKMTTDSIVSESDIL